MRRVLVALAVAGALPCAARAVCSIDTISGLAFGAYNPYAAAHLDSTISGTYSCTTPAVVTLSSGSSGTFFPRTMQSGANSLAYNVYADPARTVVVGDGTGGTFSFSAPAGAGVPFVAYGRVPAGQDASVGSYSDLLVVTFTF